MTYGLIVAAMIAAAVAQTPVAGAPQTIPQGVIGIPAPDPNAPPVIDIALRMIRAGGGGSSIARSAVRGDEQSFVYSGLGPCVVGASAADPAHANSLTWRASGRVRSVERGIAVADVEWQRLEYRAASVVAGPRVRTTLTMPLGERVAVDFVDASGSACRSDGLIFEIGVAPDHGRRLSMSGEGRSDTGTGAAAGGRGVGGGGAGRGLTPDELKSDAERRLQGAAAAREAVVVTRPMPPREYSVDVWLAPNLPGASASSSSSSSSVAFVSEPALAQRLSQVIGGTGGRFEFPPLTLQAIPASAAANRPVVFDISALVIPVGGDQLIVAITRRATPNSGDSPVSSGWIKAVSLPKAGDVLSFEIPAPSATDSAIVPRLGFGLSLRIAHR